MIFISHQTSPCESNQILSALFGASYQPVSLLPQSCFGPAAMKSCHRTVERKLPRKQVVAQRMIWLLPKGRLLQESKCRPNVDPRQKSNEGTGGQCNVRNKCLEYHHRALLLCNLGNVFLTRLKTVCIAIAQFQSCKYSRMRSCRDRFILARHPLLLLD